MSVPLSEAGGGKRLCRYLCLRQDVVRIVSVPLFETGCGKRLCRYLCLKQDVVSDCVGTSV